MKRKKAFSFALSSLNRIFARKKGKIMHIKTFVTAVMLCMAGYMHAQQTSTINHKEKDMEQENTWTAFVAIAAQEAKGNIEALKKAIDEGFEQGLTVSKIKEALSQLYAYTGFPRSLNALGALQQVVKERQEKGLATPAGKEADAMAPDYDALKQGTEVQTRLTGVPFNYEFAPQTDYYLKAHLFGDIFARNNLTHAEREIVTVSAIAALPGCEPQLKAHVNGARHMGVTDAQLCAIPALLATKVGTEEAIRCTKAVNEVCGTTLPLPADGIVSTVWPKGNLNTAYAKYFIGNSYLAPMGGADGALVNVTFEPRCRNNWHIHHKSVQVLICVSGRGWYQEWGKEAVPMTPGTVIAIPTEVKHWHGAAKDSWFQHLTYMTHVEEGASNEWLEPVNDEVYDKLK